MDGTHSDGTISLHCLPSAFVYKAVCFDIFLCIFSFVWVHPSSPPPPPTGSYYLGGKAKGEGREGRTPVFSDLLFQKRRQARKVLPGASGNFWRSGLLLQTAKSPSCLGKEGREQWTWAVSQMGSPPCASLGVLQGPAEAALGGDA